MNKPYKELEKLRHPNDIRDVQLAYVSAFMLLIKYEKDLARFLTRACNLVDKYRAAAIVATKNGPDETMGDVHKGIIDTLSQ